TTSPTARPGAPTESPSNTVPSSSARIAGWVTWGFAYVGLQEAGCTKPPARCGTVRGLRCQASGNGTRKRLPAPASAQQVGHPVPARGAPGEPLRGVKGAVGEDIAARGAVDEFQALAGAAELDRVLADDVAG